MDNYRDELDLMAMQATLFEKGAKVVPGSWSYGPGSDTFTVPLFNTLTISLSGGGGGGGRASSCIGGGPYVAGNDGNDTTLSALGLIAHSGKGANPGDTAMTGGTASGGSTNTTGGTSTVGHVVGASRISGAGGAGGSGALGGVANTVTHHTTSTTAAAGSPGASGGGGSGGAALDDINDYYVLAAGGSGGGYCTRTYTVTGGAFKYGDVLSFSVGAGAAVSTGYCTVSANGGGTTQYPLGVGAGGDGDITFTWS